MGMESPSAMHSRIKSLFAFLPLFATSTIAAIASGSYTIGNVAFSDTLISIVPVGGDGAPVLTFNPIALGLVEVEAGDTWTVAGNGPQTIQTQFNDNFLVTDPNNHETGAGLFSATSPTTFSGEWTITQLEGSAFSIVVQGTNFAVSLNSNARSTQPVLAPLNTADPHQQWIFTPVG